jgi:thioredoxin-like negative regulator of GroEL
MSKLLYFSAAWCGPCKALGPTVAQLQSEGLDIQKVDVDQDKTLSAQYGIRSIPTIVKVSTGGKLVGNQTAEAIRALYNYGD